MEENKTKKFNKKKAITISVIVLIIVIIAVVLLIINGNEKSKETILGNISNLGLVTENEDSIFYNKYEKGIVKVKGNKEYQITNETAYSMQTVGDYIYYLTTGENNNLLIKRYSYFSD